MKGKYGNFLISALLILSFVFPVTRTGGAQTLQTSDASIQKITENVRELLPYAVPVSLSEEDVVNLGAPLSTYHMNSEGELVVNDYQTYPIFINGAIEAMADVVKDADGNVTQVSIGLDYANELQQNCKDNRSIPFALLYSDEGIYLKYENEASFLCLKAFEEDAPHEKSISVTPILLYSLLTTISNIDIDYQQNLARSGPTIKILYLHNVSNTSTSCCSDGICWAACMAILSNYYKGTSYTALQIHNMLGCLGDDNYHTTEVNYLRQLGMNAGGPFDADGNAALTYANMTYFVDDNISLLLDLQDYSAGTAHNVVGYGYYANASMTSFGFYYMDPNTGSRLCSFPASGSIVIPLSGHNYTVHCYIMAY